MWIARVWAHHRYGDGTWTFAPTADSNADVSRLDIHRHLNMENPQTMQSVCITTEVMEVSIVADMLNLGQAQKTAALVITKAAFVRNALKLMAMSICPDVSVECRNMALST